MGNGRILDDRIGMNEDPLLFLHKVSGLFILQSSVFWKRCLLFQIAYLQIFITASYPKIIYGDWNYLPYTAITQTVGIIKVIIIVYLVLIALTPIILGFSTCVKNEAYSLKSAGEEVYERIAKECKLIKILCYSSMFMQSSISILGTPFIGDEHRWQFPFYLIKEHIHYLQLAFYISLYISIFINGFALGIFFNVVMYNVCHILFQWHLLNQFVIRMSRGMVFNLNDIRYQERVQKQLARCIRMQSNIMKLTKVINIYKNITILGFIIVASVIFVSAASFIVTGVSPKSNLRMSSIFVPWFELLCTICFYCQQITNESHNVFNNALQCPWYNWNIQNRKTYLLFLTGNTNVTKFSMYGWIFVESSLILKVCKISYSILTLVLRIRTRK